MAEQMKVWITLMMLFVVVCWAKRTTTYTFGKDCSVSLEHINEDRTVYVEYNGDDIKEIWCDYMSFVGRDDGYLNEYKLCVTPENYQDPDCALEMKYSSNYDGYALQTFTCSNQPVSQYCGEPDGYLYISIKGLKNDLENAKFKLKIEAIMTLDYYGRVGAIVGGVIGGLVLLSLVIGCCCYFGGRKKRSQGQVLNPSSEPMVQTHFPNTVTYASQPGGSYPSQPAGSYPTHPTGGYTTHPAGSYSAHYQPHSDGSYPSHPTGNYPTPPTGIYPLPNTGTESSQTQYWNSQNAPTTENNQTQPSAPRPAYDDVQSWSK